MLSKTVKTQRQNNAFPLYSLGFTLIELSIVLVIIGLVTGGILIGRDLIKSAELKKLYGEYQAFDVAANAYKLKYNALAGDHANAYDFFGDVCGTNHASPNTGCNGSGDLKIGDGEAGLDSIFGEEPKFFEHLSRAGLIAGNYDGSCIQQESCEYVAGVNVPRSVWNGGVWGVVYGGCELCYETAAIDNYNVFMISGAGSNGVIGNYSFIGGDPLLNVEEVWNIDSKYDDGMPNTGKIAIALWPGGANYCVSDNNTASPYNLTTATLKCIPYFRMSGF